MPRVPLGGAARSPRPPEPPRAGPVPAAAPTHPRRGAAAGRERRELRAALRGRGEPPVPPFLAPDVSRGPAPGAAERRCPARCRPARLGGSAPARRWERGYRRRGAARGCPRDGRGRERERERERDGGGGAPLSLAPPPSGLPPLPVPAPVRPGGLQVPCAPHRRRGRGRGSGAGNDVSLRGAPARPMAGPCWRRGRASGGGGGGGGGERAAPEGRGSHS